MSTEDMNNTELIIHVITEYDYFLPVASKRTEMMDAIKTAYLRKTGKHLPIY